MYAGSTLTNYSGSILGAHQKIDRVARRALKNLLTQDSSFPNKKLVLRFEGKNGPDGMKAKSTGHDEPWHFFDPFDPEDGEMLDHLDLHYNGLVEQLSINNREKAAFEAAWLAHAIVDGLTPAHQYPYEQELEKLRGESKETRDTIYKKLVIPADTKKQLIVKNWDVWGAKGLITTHAMFEWGASTIISPMHSKIAIPNRYELKTIQHLGLKEYYIRVAREVAMYDMYDLYYKKGWSPKLTKLIRRELAPRMAKTVTLAWYMASKEAGIASCEV
ncbi:MAG: hypothetical protein WCP03_02315 [Candidatus Saccharibacteria bacterium]